MMKSDLCITIRFLDPVPQFHGRNDSGDPEWPPSPLRLFQALVCAAARRWDESQFQDIAAPALRWLETISPVISTPHVADASVGYRMYVPNNSGDLMTAAWARGDTETSMAKFRVEKDVRPTNLAAATVRFLFPLEEGSCPFFGVLQTAARSVTHLGWGVNMVAGDAEMADDCDLECAPGEVWQPVPVSQGSPLRVPIVGTLDALIAKHGAFLSRIGPSGFKPVPPLSAFRLVGYRLATKPTRRQFAAFSILKPDASSVRSFDTLRRTRDLAGMIRHATDLAARDQGWTNERINEFVHGKVPDGTKPPSGETSPDRFQYLPLPTINSKLKRVESIRRILIAAPPHCTNQIAWVRRSLAGAELINHEGPVGLLTILSGTDWVLKQYIDESTEWSTVTPVILPGYDDPDHLRRKLKDVRDAETQQRYLARLSSRVENLLRKAFRQAGYSDELMEQTEFEWRDVGFRAGVDLASRYLPPENLNKSPRYHVKVRFPFPVAGPVAVGSGRFRGFGLFAKTVE